MKRVSWYLNSLIVVVMALVVTSIPAKAQNLMDFNDLGASTGGTHMPAAYNGFAWAGTDWHYMSNAFAPGNTYLALSGSSTQIRRTDGTAFFFDGADFWSRRGLDAAGDFYFVLYYRGSVVYNGRTEKQKIRFTGTPTLFRPPYTGLVDMVAFAFDKPGRGGDWDHLAMDNFRTHKPIAAR